MTDSLTAANVFFFFLTSETEQTNTISEKGNEQMKSAHTIMKIPPTSATHVVKEKKSQYYQQYIK